MFTVVIAEKQHIDKIREYKSYLDPMLADDEVRLCLWRPAELTLDDAVPDLQTVVGRQSVWRAVIVCEDKCRDRKNPFEVVRFQEGATPLMDRDEAWYADLRQRKFAAYEEAARQPLVRLASWLCEPPLTTAGLNHAENEDPAFAEYQAETAKKAELRSAICEGTRLCITRPAEVLCIAQRTYTQQEYDIQTSWTEHVELHYSRFADWNLYFDKMRYLVFDIVPADHYAYSYDYLRFLYSILLVAGHDVPADSLRPNRVYSVECEDDRGMLQRLLGAYDTKLLSTSEMLQHRLEQTRREKKRRLSDEQARTIFCARVNVPVSISGEVDQSDLLAKKNAVGLAADCPEDEYGAWDRRLTASRKTVTRLLKQPRRSLRRSVSSLRGMNAADTDQALLLNDFQVEDVEEHTYDEERRMVSEPVPELFDTSELDRDVEALDKAIKDKLETRMTRKTAIILGIAAIVLFLLGFLPLIFNNMQTVGRLSIALIILAVAAGVMLVTGIVCLFCLRESIRRLLVEFNDRMRRFRNDLDSAMLSFSSYLSHACNVMRGFSVLNYCDRYRNSDTKKEILLRKHIQDMQECRAGIREIFGDLAAGLDASAEQSADPDVYLYDYSRPVDYVYALPLQANMSGEIEFMAKGNYIQVPVRYIRRVGLRREELYD